jgi:hypothetical protein
MQKERYQSQINQNFGTVFSYRALPYFFEVGSQTFRNFEVAASKFNIDQSLTSMASKTALPYISKMASNQCIYSKD